MIILFALAAFLILGLTAIVGSYLLKWLSGLVSPPLASMFGKEEARIKGFVQTAILFVFTLLLVFCSQKSCSRGQTINEVFGRAEGFEKIAFLALGWLLLITAVICFGVTIRRFRSALAGDKPKVKARKVF